MVELQEKIWSGHLGDIKIFSHRIELKAGNHPLHQQPYCAGPEQNDLIKEHVKKILAAEDIEAGQIDWASPVDMATNNDSTPRFSVDYEKFNDVTIPDLYQVLRM